MSKLCSLPPTSDRDNSLASDHISLSLFQTGTYCPITNSITMKIGTSETSRHMT